MALKPKINDFNKYFNEIIDSCCFLPRGLVARGAGFEPAWPHGPQT